MKTPRIFQKISRPRTVVGLQVAATSMNLVKIVNTLKGPEIVETHSIEVERPEDRVDRLTGLFHRPELKYDLLVVSIASSYGNFRRISLPFLKPRKLDKIIRFQMEPYIPTPIEDILVDYLPVGGDGNTVLVGLEKRVLREHLELFKSAGVDPDMVLLDEVALFSLYAAAFHSDGAMRAPAAVVHFGKESVGIQIADKEAVKFIRILPKTRNIFPSIADTLNIYSVQENSVPPNKIYLIGEPSERRLAGKIGEMAGTQVTTWEPWMGIKSRSGSGFRKNPARFAVPLGAALGPSTGTFRPLNFRKEEFSVQSAVDMRRKIGNVLILFLLLTGLLTFHFYQREHIQIKQYEKINNRMKEVFLDTFPETSRIVKGRELAQMKQKMIQEKNRLDWVIKVEDKNSILEIFRWMTDRMARFPGLYLDNFFLDGENVEVEGNAANFEMVNKLKEAFQEDNFFSAVKLTGAKTTQQEGKVRFHIVMVKK